MAFGKWNVTGDLTWVDSEILFSSELNDTLDEAIQPVGSIMAWAKSFTGVPNLPIGWVECDGSTLSDSDSPLDGETLPDLNGDNRFLRGDSTSGTTGGAGSHTHGNPVSSSIYGHDGSNQQHASSSNLPVYYEIVWIIRIK